MTGNEKLPEAAAPLASPGQALRQQAEAAFLEKAARSPEALGRTSPEATQRTLHELGVHQIELEMQNEELRRAHVELDASRARYFDLYHLAPVGYCSLSGPGLILQANLIAATKLGVARGALLVGQPISRFILKEDGDNYYLLRKKLIETGEPQSCELRMVRKDGTQFWAHLASTVTPDADGGPVILLVMSDVTERKLLQIQAANAEEEIRQWNASLEQRVRERTVELRENEERFHTLANNISQLAWMADAQGSIFWYNQRWFDYTGTTLEEMFGWGWQKVHHPDHVQRVVDKIKHCFETGEVWEDTFPLRGTDGQYRWFLSRAVPIRDEHGTVLRWFGTNTDITERKQAEEAIQQLNAELHQRAAQLEAAVKDLEQFAYVASHDLQEPLRAVAGCVEILEKDYRDKLDANASELIRHTVEGTRRMQTLINDLLAYSRVGRRGQPLEPTDCNAALAKALANLSAAIGESGAAITHDPLPTLLADPTLLPQLFQNLIANGIKFCTGRRPEIHVGAQRQDGVWRFSVRDNGIGIEPQYRDRIFVIFQRLHTRTEYPGTGIGLAICKRIAERHGGEISVESEPGKGSKFHFSIAENGNHTS